MQVVKIGFLGFVAFENDAIFGGFGCTMICRTVRPCRYLVWVRSLSAGQHIPSFFTTTIHKGPTQHKSLKGIQYNERPLKKFSGLGTPRSQNTPTRIIKKTMFLRIIVLFPRAFLLKTFMSIRITMMSEMVLNMMMPYSGVKNKL